MAHRSGARFGALMALLFTMSVSCARNPVTGQQQISLISEEQEIEMGAEAAQEVIRTIGLVDDEGLQRYVGRIGTQLAAESERPNLPWTFAVVDDPTPNAFALPGGYIFITRGMLGLMDSEAELATILGHEIGHVTARHSVERISRAQLAQIGLGLGSILVPGVGQLSGVLGAGLQLLFLEYSRDDERQADSLGFTYALDQGYDVREMDDIFMSLEQLSGGRSALPTWASTHPTPGSRVAAVQERLEGLRGPVESLRVGRAEFLGEIDGLAYGTDPRSGFFEDGAFYHPDLAFQVRFPSGWTTQNLAQAVVAVSPREDAVIQLGLAGGTPEQAANAFLNQGGVSAGQVSRVEINGLPAVVATFQGRTQQGVVAGTVGFISHGGDTYAVLGYTPAQRIGTYQDEFANSIQSFARLTDRSLLAVQPLRIDIVQLADAMTASEFLRRYPTEIGAEESLIINQLDASSQVLPEGMLLKRVVRPTRTTAMR